MTPKLVTLEAWAAAIYETPPSMHTLRRWARNGNICPMPQRHGRSYYVDPDALYVKIDPKTGMPQLRLVHRIMLREVEERTRAMRKGR